MTTHYLTITPHDPVIARDGRPFGFGQGQRMRSLDWLYPSVLAGSLRTLLGKSVNGGFENLVELLAIGVAGPLPMYDSQLYFPAPADQVVYKKEDDSSRVLMPLRPVKDYKCTDDYGCDLEIGLSPIKKSGDAKAEKVPEFWSLKRMREWLLDPSGTDFAVPPDPQSDDNIIKNGYLKIPAKDERFHTAIVPETGEVVEGRFFKTVGLDCAIKNKIDMIHLAARAQSSNGTKYDIGSINQYHPIGGERRLAHWKSDSQLAKMWIVPDEIQQRLKGTTHLRMILATPAIFSDGWKPGWLSNNLEGVPPNSNVELKLISACVERWKPISGWSLEKGKTGPKAVRRLVPAGSVYFFEVLNGSASDLAKSHWLQSVCDEKQDRRDGFGLTLLGMWEYA